MRIRTLLARGSEDFGFHVDRPLDPLPNTGWRLSELDVLELLATDPDPFGASVAYATMTAQQMSKIVSHLNNQSRFDPRDQACQIRIDLSKWEAHITFDWYSAWLNKAVLVFWGMMIRGMLLEVKAGRMSDEVAEMLFTPGLGSFVNRTINNLEMLAITEDIIGIGHEEGPWVAGPRKRVTDLITRNLEDLKSLPYGIWWTPEVLRKCISNSERVKLI